MAEGGIPAEVLISLRRRLDAMPARSADRKGLIVGAAALYGVSRATLYRALKQQPRPRAIGNLTARSPSAMRRRPAGAGRVRDERRGFYSKPSAQYAPKGSSQ
jgi:hypothetical protein